MLREWFRTKRAQDFIRQLSRETVSEKGYYSASMIGNCLRRHYYDRQGCKEIPYEALMAMHLGNLAQDFIDGVLKETFGDSIVTVERTVTVRVPYGDAAGEEFIAATGRLDQVLAFTDAGNARYYLPLECKYLVSKLVKDVKEPNRKHLYQLAIYLLAMGAPLGKLYYVDHAMNTVTFDVECTKELVTEALDRVKTIHSYVKVNTLPPAEAMYSDDKWLKEQCWFCPHQKQCNEIEKGGK